MNKKRFTIMPRHNLTRYYLGPSGAKIAHVQPLDNDTSCHWYVWDKKGNYKGVHNTMRRKSSLTEINRDEFLRCE